MRFFRKMIRLLSSLRSKRQQPETRKIAIPGIIESRELKLQTRAGNDIRNSQTSLMSSWDRHQFKQYEKGFKNVKRRTTPTPIYNCHGLTFGGRRTAIDYDQVPRILDEDEYEEIKDHDKVLPGDIILYFNGGDIEHAGVVISRPEDTVSLYTFQELPMNYSGMVSGRTTNRLRVPQVYSKWGKYCECIHFANDCPYEWTQLKYYRIVK